MPILTKNGQRIYFVHIPTVPATPLYYTHLKAGYEISNLGPKDGAWIGPDAEGVKAKIAAEFEVKHFPQEGDVTDVFSDLQHATWEFWSRWGPFEGSLCLIRHPLERFCLGLGYLYKHVCENQGLAATPAYFGQFQKQILPELRFKMSRWTNWKENKFLGLQSYILPQTRLFCLDQHGLNLLADMLGTQAVALSGEFSPDGFSEPLLAFARDYYRDDIALYERVEKANADGQIPTVVD